MVIVCLPLNRPKYQTVKNINIKLYINSVDKTYYFEKNKQR